MAKRTKIKRTKLIDRKSSVRDARLFVIATEGQKTEQQYFRIFGNSRVHIEVLATGEDNKSAPKYVLSRLNNFVEQYDLRSEDILCVMFDVDNWEPQMLGEVCREARQKKYLLAISNPCFEVWLHLHLAALDSGDTTCKDFEQKLRKELGSYNKSNLNLDRFQGKVEAAIKRAKELHSNPRQNWPQTPGSHVYRVVEIIVKAIR